MTNIKKVLQDVEFQAVLLFMLLPVVYLLAKLYQ